VLSVREAVRLRGVCKALKVLVREWPVDLGMVMSIEAALTCFPAAETLGFAFSKPLAPGFLKVHGGTIKRVRSIEWGRPQCEQVDFYLEKPTHRAILSGGMLPLLEQVNVCVHMADKQQVAALGHLRRLPHLRFLRLSSPQGREAAIVNTIRFPPFVPPSLKILRLDSTPPVAPLRELLSMLQGSGAKLEQLLLSCTGRLGADFGAALAQVLRACSSTLKVVRLMGRPDSACICELMPGLMSCRDTLEVLGCPWAVFSALPATCPGFPRLTALILSGGHGGTIEFASWPTVDCPPSPRCSSPATAGWLSWGPGEPAGEGLRDGGGHAQAADPHSLGGEPSCRPRDAVHTSWARRSASCGASESSTSTYSVMVGPTTPWPGAWPTRGDAPTSSSSTWTRSRRTATASPA
jgi:hypothetical protein